MNNLNVVTRHATFTDTVREIFRMTLEKRHEVAWMLDRYDLRHRDALEAAKKVHAFTTKNVKYKRDPKGLELVRSAAQTWHDKDEGVDCEDLSIFQTSLMQLQGHGRHVYFTIVDLDEFPGMDHIYTSLLSNGLNTRPAIYTGTQPLGIAFDACLPQFGVHPKGIVKSMELATLSGIPQVSLGAVAKPSDMLEGKNKRKAQWIEMAAGAGSNRAVASIMPYVDDIGPDGVIVWKRGTDLNAVARIVEANDAALDGLGRRKSDGKPKDRPGRTPLQAMAHVFPLAIVGRNAFLAMVALNGFRLASHLRLIFLDPETARRSPFNQDALAKAMAARPKIEKAWKALGGDMEALKKAIAKGAHVDADRLSGLGDPATATVAAAAAPVLAVIVPLVTGVDFKDLGIEGNPADGTGKLDSGKLAAGVKSLIDKFKKNKTTGQNETEQSIIDAGNDGNPDRTPPPPPVPEKSNTLLYVGIGVVAVAGIGAAIYFSNQD